jgi:hypothetical protein
VRISGCVLRSRQSGSSSREVSKCVCGGGGNKPLWYRVRSLMPVPSLWELAEPRHLRASSVADWTGLCFLLRSRERERAARASVRSGRVRVGVGNVQLWYRARSLMLVYCHSGDRDTTLARMLLRTGLDCVSCCRHARERLEPACGQDMCVWAWATYSCGIGCVR